jgi:hypothetical protein
MSLVLFILSGIFFLVSLIDEYVLEGDNAAFWFLLAFLSVFIGACFYVNKDETQCIKEHGTNPYMTEKVIGSTKDGCKLLEVHLNTCGKSPTTFYITNCKSITWKERQGKTTVDRTTTNED